MRKIILTFSILLFACAIIVGFITNDDGGKKNLSQKSTSFSNETVVVRGPELDNPLSTLSESFEGATFPPAGWIKLNPDGGTGWASITSGTTPLPGWNGGVATVPTGGGTKTAYATWNTGGATANDQWLVSPQITNVQPNDSLKFWIRKPGYVNNYLDNFNVKISTTTPVVASFTINVLTLTSPAVTSDTNWVEYKFRLGDFVTTGSNIYIGFREWVLDNVNDGAAYQLDLIRVVEGGAPVVSSWTEQVSPLTTGLQSVSAVNDNVAWTCGVAGKVLRTTNKGVTWTNVSGTIGASYSLVNIFAWDANTCLVTGYSGANTIIYRTTDGGTTWTSVYGPVAGFIDNIYMTDANTAYYIGDPIGGAWDLKKSTNGGVNWTTWSTLTTTNTSGTYNNAGCFLGTNVWFSGNGDNTINFSSNMGANWTSQPNAQAELGAIWFNSATNGLIGGFTGSLGVKYTTNSGVNWTAVTNPATVAFIGITGSGNEYWAASQGLNIYYTSNAGTNWSTSYTVTTGNFGAMQKARTGNTIWGVRGNGGISRYGTPITGITSVGSEIPSSYSVSQNYPNPFNPTTKINFALPKSGLVTMKVYDILGKEVATLVNEVKNAGSYSVDFNAANLTSGMYFYKVSVNGFSEVKKMMLIK